MTKPRRRQAGEGSISAYETKAGTRYLIKYRDPVTGKVILRRGWPTRKAAAEELGDALARVRKGEHVAPSKQKLADWLQQWLDGLQVAPSTLASYRKNVRLHIAPALGDVPLQQLTGARISAAYRAMEAGGRRDHRAGEGLSPRTVRYVHTILKSALRDAVDQGLLVTNPAAKAKPPSDRASKPPEVHPWTGDQLRTFLAWAWEANPLHAPAWHLLAYTGIRRGELLALRWRDLDLAQGTLAVRRSVGVVKVEGDRKRVQEGATKSARSRVLDLDDTTLEVLRRWRVDLAKLSLQLTADDAHIFGRLEGDGPQHPERFSARFVEKQNQAARQLADAAPPRIHLHDLRHTHASLLLKAGVPVKVVTERLGHASTTITLEIYAHVMPGMQSEAAATFARLVEGGGAS